MFRCQSVRQTRTMLVATGLVWCWSWHTGANFRFPTAGVADSPTVTRSPCEHAGADAGKLVEAGADVGGEHGAPGG